MIKRFETYLEVEKNYSKNTIREYLYDLNLFNRFLKKNIVDATDIDVKNFLTYLKKDKKYSAKTLYRKQATLKSFYKFCLRENRIIKNPMMFIESPKLPERHPVYLIDNERIAILNEVRKKMHTLRDVRDYAILVLLYYTGLRISELTSLNINDIYRDGFDLYLRVIGKGNKERHIPLNKEAKEVLENWLNQRPKTGVLNEAIFINTSSKDRLNNRSIQIALKKVLKKVGIAKKVTPHTFRHTFATKLFQSGVNLVELQTLLGHATIGSTRIYVHTNKDRLRKAVDKL